MSEAKCQRCGGSGLTPLPRLPICSAAMKFLAAGCRRDSDGGLWWNCVRCGGSGREPDVRPAAGGPGGG